MLCYIILLTSQCGLRHHPQNGAPIVLSSCGGNKTGGSSFVAGVCLYDTPDVNDHFDLLLAPNLNAPCISGAPNLPPSPIYSILHTTLLIYSKKGVKTRSEGMFGTRQAGQGPLRKRDIGKAGSTSRGNRGKDRSNIYAYLYMISIDLSTRYLKVSTITLGPKKKRKKAMMPRPKKKNDG
jgi:hypothetical protein